MSQRAKLLYVVHNHQRYHRLRLHRRRRRRQHYDYYRHHYHQRHQHHELLHNDKNVNTAAAHNYCKHGTKCASVLTGALSRY